MKRIILTLVLSFLSFGAAQAALIDRGDGFIYDSDQDITWTQDADINGLKNWYGQMAWADGYSQTHTVYGTFDDWRLATTLQPDPSCSGQSGGFSYNYDCTGSEMGHLFNVDGISGGSMGLFTNVQSNKYWSGTESTYLMTTAWYLDFSSGNQNTNDKLYSYGYAFAVRDGDIASVVPIPAAVYLFASGLGLLGWVRKKTN